MGPIKLKIDDIILEKMKKYEKNALQGDLFSNGKAHETEEVEHIALFSCNVCGYLLEEAELPRGYRCPVCEATEDMFMRVVER